MLTGQLQDDHWLDMAHVPTPDGGDFGRLNGLVKLDPHRRPLPPESARWGARLERRGELTVAGPFNPYTAPVADEIRAAITRAGKLLVLVTEEVRIDDIRAGHDIAALYAAVHQGHVHGAWAVLGADPADVQFHDRDPLAGLVRGAAAVPGTAGMPIAATPLTSTAQYQQIENDVTAYVRAGFSDHRALRLSPPGTPRYPVLLLEPQKSSACPGPDARPGTSASKPAGAVVARGQQAEGPGPHARGTLACR